jgi:hypothetical protein
MQMLRRSLEPIQAYNQRIVALAGRLDAEIS